MLQTLPCVRFWSNSIKVSIKTKGVLNEGHDTLAWVLLACNQISNDVRVVELPKNP